MQAEQKRAVVLVNTKSRRGKEWYPQVIAALPKHGVVVERAMPLTDPKRLIKETRDAIAAGTPLVIVGGGDGTMSSVARYFIGSRSVMGVLPLGTGNQFARDLSIHADVETACEVIGSGKIVGVDVGFAGTDHFLNVATAGLTTLIAQELKDDAKRRLGRFVYLFALVRALRRLVPFRAKLTTPEQTLEFDTIQVVIGNGKYHAGPFPLAPDAAITNGNLIVYALATRSRMELLRFALHLPGGHQGDLVEVPTFHTTGGTLTTTPVQKVTVDGEIAEQTPLTFGIRPRALQVMVPQDFVE
jgi:diacylglycerol kinase (ATP)